MSKRRQTDTKIKLKKTRSTDFDDISITQREKQVLIFFKTFKVVSLTFLLKASDA